MLMMFEISEVTQPGEVWKREGGLVEVIDGLVELLAPDDPKAPQLAKATAPELLVHVRKHFSLCD